MAALATRAVQQQGALVGEVQCVDTGQVVEAEATAVEALAVAMYMAQVEEEAVPTACQDWSQEAWQQTKETAMWPSALHRHPRRRHRRHRRRRHPRHLRPL